MLMFIQNQGAIQLKYVICLILLALALSIMLFFMRFGKR